MDAVQLFLKVPLINLSKYSQAGPTRRNFCYSSPFAQFKYFRYIFLNIVVYLIWACCAYAGEDELTDDQARQQCFQGKTIYCLALGIKEEKAGHQERALELYRTACKKYSTPGHLRACTPLLSLAWKMKRLNEEVAPLETLCKKGNSTTCFYLGKEYLKLVEMEDAVRHLKPLCRSHFRSPTSDDHGPCYHLAKGYEQTGQWNQARELFHFDCETNSQHAQPSCKALEELTEMENTHRELAQKGIRISDPIEDVLLFLVLISVLNVWIWFKGGRQGLRYLSLAAPLVVWGSALVWVYWPEKPEFPH